MYAFATYDQSPVHNDELMPADILMANLLSLRLGWRDVIPLFATDLHPWNELRDRMNAALVEARRLASKDDWRVSDVPMPVLDELNAFVHSLGPVPERKKRTWTTVTVSKVLHRLAEPVKVSWTPSWSVVL
jgi:hypothetical protein